MKCATNTHPPFFYVDYSHFHSIRRDLEEQCKQAMDTLSRFAIHDTVSRLAAQAETQLVSLTKGVSPRCPLTINTIIK